MQGGKKGNLLDSPCVHKKHCSYNINLQTRFPFSYIFGILDLYIVHYDKIKTSELKVAAFRLTMPYLPSSPSVCKISCFLCAFLTVKHFELHFKCTTGSV